MNAVGRSPGLLLATSIIGATVMILGISLSPAQQPDPSLHPGPLLYQTHCRACHDEQVHWRDARKVRDWTMLVREVGRWQQTLGLGWGDDEIRQVAHYLNLRYYRFAPAPPRVIVDAGR